MPHTPGDWRWAEADGLIHPPGGHYHGAAVALVFDVGMHNGDDSAHYLSLGHRVVAVEANPALCSAAAERFATEIADGRLTIEHLAIAAEHGEVPFYVTASHTEFSSLDRSVASRHGLEVKIVTVHGAPLTDLLDKHGTPVYLKIDIERADGVCLDALIGRRELPRFVSVEAHELDYLCRLWMAGYRRFKVVDQTGHNWPRLVSNESVLGRVRQFGWHYVSRFRSRRGGLQFAPGSSGPFGDATPGDWQDLETVAYEWLHFQTGHRRRGTLNPRGWFDFHAAL
jgi:FkbM family methyltransferase